jgi:hypothetical protein
MATIISNDGQSRWEKPLASTDSVNPAAVDFISGDYPELLVVPMFVREGEIIYIGSPVGGQLDDFNNGEVYNVGSIDTLSNPGNAVSFLVGIALTATRPNGAEAGDSILVARAGCFDPDKLTWRDDVAGPWSESEKLQAFERTARSPVQIVLRKRIASAL